MSGASRQGRTTVNQTDLDDWETDPDFVRDMDEIDQRWGSKRTVGSINMNELIDEVRRDHKVMRDKFNHPSQRDHSEGFGGKFGIQHDRRDPSALDYDYHEKLSKHTSQEIRKVITSSTSSLGGSPSGVIGPNLVSDAKKRFMERTEDRFESSRPMSTAKSETTNHQQRPAKPSVPSKNFTTTRSPEHFDRNGQGSTPVGSGVRSPGKFEESSTTRRIVREEKSSSSSGKNPIASDMLPAFKSIQEKIDAFKKEFEDIENKMAKKSDLSKVIKKTTNVEKSSNVEYVTRSGQDPGKPLKTTAFEQPSTSRPTSTSPSSASLHDLPKSSIKSLSERFETLCRDDTENFRRQTEAKRKDFFDQIKNQVRETRKELDGFDPIDDDGDEDGAEIRGSRSPGVDKLRDRLYKSTSSLGKQYAGPSATTTPTTNRYTTSPKTSPSPQATSEQQFTSRPSSYLSGANSYSSSSINSKPKIYTRRETTQEEIISKVVKENDKVVENETKRNVERSSSCHGSSDEDEPSSIKYLDRKLRSSPSATGSGQERTESPIDELKRRVPVVETEVKGAGLMARTLYDYEAAADDELTFELDDLITNIEKVDSGWYKGTIVYKDGRKREGLFPANYVKLLNDSGEY